MRLTLMTFVILLVLMMAKLVVASTQDTVDIEKIEITGEKLEKLSTSVSEYVLYRDLGISALHAKNYENALRLLTRSAEQGHKDSQFFLAKMYFEGLGTPVNNELGWAWMNVALEEKTPERRFAFEKVSDAIPEEVQKHWAPTVEKFMQQYGAEATGHTCRQKKELGTNLITVQCTRMTDGSLDPLDFRTMQALFFKKAG
ncbi:tetratricopeptide repeat protein [Alteromonas facilis]|uniref:tetratricopeptide repeat protein n=1 Tax=Alteromonas facilis TaxID=2048004 RepID=UPI000C289DD1|nr:SEL1-like repeat protein [Alteromonas facilis]